jgi:hypothetical protein
LFFIVPLWYCSVYQYCGATLVNHQSNRIEGVMISVLASSVVYRGFDASLRRKSKDWLIRNLDKVSEWGDMSIRGLLFR